MRATESDRKSAPKTTPRKRSRRRIGSSGTWPNTPFGGCGKSGMQPRAPAHERTVYCTAIAHFSRLQAKTGETLKGKTRGRPVRIWRSYVEGRHLKTARITEGVNDTQRRVTTTEPTQEYRVRLSSGESQTERASHGSQSHNGSFKLVRFSPSPGEYFVHRTKLCATPT